MLPYLVVPLISARVPLISTRGSAHCQAILLKDLIAATSLVTLFHLCDLEIGPMALKNNRDLFPCPFQLCVSFHSHQCIQLRLTVQKCSNQVKIVIFLSPMTTKLDRWHWKTKGHLSYASSTFMHHFIVFSEFKFELQSGNAQIRSILTVNFFASCDLEISQMTFNKANLSDLIAATGLVILLKLDSNRFFARVTLKFDGWPEK